jgi:hypothetical protein
MGRLLDLTSEVRTLIYQYYLEDLRLEIRLFKARYLYCSNPNDHVQISSYLQPHKPTCVQPHTEQCLPYKRGFSRACRQLRTELLPLEAQRTNLVVDTWVWLDFKSRIPSSILQHIRRLTVRDVRRAEAPCVRKLGPSTIARLTLVLPCLERLRWISNESFYAFDSLHDSGDIDFLWKTGVAEEALYAVGDPVKPSRNMEKLCDEIQEWAHVRNRWLQGKHSGSYLVEITFGVVRFREDVDGDKSFWVRSCQSVQLFRC